jgi:hypothetical protein
VAEANVWTVEQVAAVAPSSRSIAAAEPLAEVGRWSPLGGDERALWGRCRGSGAEPYDTSVDHVEVAWRCTCPSRTYPCKHALALLLLWVRGGVPEAPRPESVESWIERRDRRPANPAAPTSPGGMGSIPSADGERATSGSADDPHAADQPGADGDGSPPTDREQLDRSRDQRVTRMMEGLLELDRWLEDRIRTGLADPALARYGTWDQLAARLVDARAGALANRVRRLAGLVGASPDWHAEVLAELGLLHLIAQAGRRLPSLPSELADAVATASGWQVRHADVLGGVPETDEWFVAGRSDTREDRIEVRRLWLRGIRSGRWAMLLSFAAYQQSLDDSFTVGTVVHADLHRYPGGSLRALAGRRYADPLPFTAPSAATVVQACDEIGRAIAAEPWLERYPATVSAAPSVLDGRWVITDASGSLPLQGDDRSLGALLAACAGAANPDDITGRSAGTSTGDSTGDSLVDMTIEWTPWGVRLLTVHLPDRTLDLGPRADASFVGVS